MSPEQDTTSPIGRSWKDTLGVNNKEDGEKKCDELNLAFEWLGDDLKVINKIPLSAIQVFFLSLSFYLFYYYCFQQDERTKKKVWFNSIVAAYTQWNDVRNKGEKAVAYGNGDYFDPTHINGTLDIPLFFLNYLLFMLFSICYYY